MNLKRGRLHFFFWLIYFSITYFNELFLTSDFTGFSGWEDYLKILWGELNLVCIKIALVYYVLYVYLPRWAKAEMKFTLVVEGMLTLLCTVVLYRVVIQYINWKFILHHGPGVLSMESQIARFLYSLLEILQITAIAATIKLLRMRIAESEREKALVREKLKAELGHLKAQINPHFLFNMLNNVYSLSRMQSPQTSDVVLRLSSLLRYMLYESEKVSVSVEDEIKIINDYIDMQEVRFDNRVRISREYELDNPAAAITPLLLFPFIENAFKHGVGSSGDNSFVHLSILLKDEVLTMQVENSIAGESVMNDEDSGIGLSNIRKQLQLLYKEYRLDILPGEKFIVNLTINLKSYAGFELYNSGR